ncbi:MAG: hypothetical protein RLZZ235_1510, partial [Pseudomonadota bacterium]
TTAEKLGIETAAHEISAVKPLVMG